MQSDDFAQHRWAVVERSKMLLDLGRVDEALGALRPELARDPDDLDLLRLTAAAELRVGRAEEAVRLTRRASVLAPDDERAWRVLAEALLVLGRVEEAEEAARRGSVPPDSSTSASPPLDVERRSPDGGDGQPPPEGERRGRPRWLGGRRDDKS